LTKIHETVHRGSAADLAENPPDCIDRGEIVLVCEPVPSMSDEDAGTVARGVSAVNDLVDAGVPRRRACSIIAKLLGISARSLYEGTIVRPPHD
jgi:16S rRNA C1402 (ribose-2'-O) methylase RsmI